MCAAQYARSLRSLAVQVASVIEIRKRRYGIVAPVCPALFGKQRNAAELVLSVQIHDHDAVA